MKAVQVTAKGGVEALSFVDMLEPEIATATDVKIRIRAAGVNPIDTKVRKGGLFYPDAYPSVLGCDGCGEVVAVADGVTQFQVGDEVWYCHGGLGKEQGNYAQYTVVDERWLAKKPQSIDFISAAAAPLVLITAWGALFARGHLRSGQTVLIHAGAGGVGHVAIQMAKISGATVITTVSNDEKASFVKSLGADHVINYHNEDVVQAVNEITAGNGADLVLDTVSPEVFKTSIPAVAHFGTIVTLLDPGEFDFSEARMRNLSIAFELMLTPMLRDLHQHRDQHVIILKQCGQWIDEGKLRIQVSEKYPLEQAAVAHATLEQGHQQGKIILLTD